MPRSRRIAVMDRAHIVLARGNAGGTLFFTDSDFEAYLEKLRDLVREDHFTLYAYALMRTELRLVLRPHQKNLPQTIQALHTAHARRINNRLNRRGHLFEGRFRSLVISDEAVPQAVRAIHLWPARKGRVVRAETYPWSSHRAYVARGDEWGDLVDAWAILEGFGDTMPVAQRAFARFVESVALEPDTLGVEEVFPGVAGSRRFAEAVLAEAGVEWKSRRRPALKTLSARVSLLMNVSTEDIRSPSRLQDLVVARRLLSTAAVRAAGRTVTEVAKFIHRDKAQVSRLVAQGMAQARSDEAFRVLMDQVSGARRPLAPTGGRALP